VDILLAIELEFIRADKCIWVTMRVDRFGGNDNIIRINRLWSEVEELGNP
jgi:hypothetical protein